MFSRITHATLALMISVGMMPAPVMVLADSHELDSGPASEADISEGDLIPETDEVIVEEQEVVSTSDMLHFLLDVRWGNVEGEVTDREEANFDGSVSVPSTGHVTLRQKLLFESHDELTSERDPVSWTSLIYGHWDGVRVAVSAQAGDMVTVETTQGTYSDSARALFESTEPIVYDVGSGKEIILRARPLERRGFFMAVGWGHPNRHAKADAEPVSTDTNAVITDGTRVNFSGSASVGGNSVMKAVRPLRFERLQGDRIAQATRQLVKWRSIINGGMDGVLLRLHPDRTNDASDELTIAFTELGFEMSWPLIDLFHSDVTEVTVPVPGHDVDHVLILRRWRHPHGKLIRGRSDSRVYFVEGDLRRHVVSADAFARAGLDWGDVSVVDDEDVDVYADGSPFGYEDGEIIKGSGPEVFVITNGKRRHVKDPDAFARLGYDWNNLIVIPDTDVEQYDLDENALDSGAEAPEGALLRVEGDPKVYVVEGGRRKHVPNPDVFAARGLRWDHVQLVGTDVVDELPVGDDLNYPNGAVVQALDGRVFEIVDGERHHLRSGKELLLRGHTWESIRRDETDVLIHRFEDGEPVELLDDVPTL